MGTRQDTKIDVLVGEDVITSLTADEGTMQIKNDSEIQVNGKHVNCKIEITYHLQECE